MKHIYLYGPPGSGKSTIGRILANNLDLPFLDLDVEIEKFVGQSIPNIMAEKGESTFRDLETAAIKKTSTGNASVIALGGGALLRDENHACAEASGDIVFLESEKVVLISRLKENDNQRPLLLGEMEEKLVSLLERRREHYQSFKLRVANNDNSPEHITWEIQKRAGRFHVHRMGAGYDVLVKRGGLETLGKLIKERNLNGPIALVSDSNVAPLYAEKLAGSLRKEKFEVHLFTIQAGEKNKTLETVLKLWRGFIKNGLDRKSTVVALGGGMTSDLAAFAASTFMRGISWVCIPTTLLAMVDASIGGKTGFDLPEGKNLIGAFHSPRLVLSDPDVLLTLPEHEFRSGLAEVVKHGIISDHDLYKICSKGIDIIKTRIFEVVCRAVAVKIQIIETDPYESGIREALNLGHTIGHAIESVSNYSLKHGEAIAIGIVAEAQLAENIGIADKGLSESIAAVFNQLSLPIKIPKGLPRDKIIRTMRVDKKKRQGIVHFSLPVKIGEVRTGIEIDDLNALFVED